MAKKKIIKGEKPHEILELEKFYAVSLDNKEAQLNLDGRHDPYSYSLNADELIISISIPEKKIRDVTLFSSLRNLELLNLTRNDIEDISPIKELHYLKYLFLGGNKIKDASLIVHLKDLLALAIWKNPIRNIELIGQLIELQGLYCQETNLSDLSFLDKLENLYQLYASENKISNIDILSSLKNLRCLKLENNLIKEIPKKLAEKFNWLSESLEDSFSKDFGLYISGNPLTYPPFSVIELGPETVKSYYEMAEEYGHAPLSEGRILFVGDGSSGKTSLIEQVLYNTFDENRKQTNGIKIEDMHLQHPEDGRDLAFHIWDFGGQEIQHAVHKFFFTEGCLYVLVLDNRKEEEPEYWLQQIEGFGGKAPVMMVFNKQDENAAETVDRKYLKEKYPNIVSFYNTSCANGFGIEDFKRDLERQAVQLRTIEEQFPNNWFAIKKAIQQCTSGKQHYLNYDSYIEICRKNHVEQEEVQHLLLRYFTTIGAVTWFGDTYLNFMHVLNPAWITQGVYKIITAQKTVRLFGQINISDFKELLHPVNGNDYTYDEKHYGYILAMMKKFDLCYTPDDKIILIPSAFGKEPKVEYRDFRGEQVRTYILNFKDYMPLALIHKYITIKLPEAFENNFWYTGIVTQDPQTGFLAMVHADKEAKRIYVRIKGQTPMGVWEYIRRVFDGIVSGYANIKYQELVSLDDNAESTVDYEDLISHIQASKAVYFHPKLKQEFYVGYLMGMFESKEESLQKFQSGKLQLREENWDNPNKLPPIVVNILNQNSPTISANVNTQINIDIDIQVVNNISSEVKGDASYLLEELGDSNKTLQDALIKVIQFADDTKAAQNSGHVKEKGWGRKLKGVLQTLKSGNEYLKSIQDGGETLKSIFHRISELAQQFNLHDIVELLKTFS